MEVTATVRRGLGSEGVELCDDRAARPAERLDPEGERLAGLSTGEDD